MKFHSWLLLYSVLYSSFAHAQLGEAPLPQLQKQPEASLEDTQRWIADRIREIGAQTETTQEWQKHIRNEIFFNGCDFSIWGVSASYHQKYTDGSLRIWERQGNLAQVNPDRLGSFDLIPIDRENHNIEELRLSARVDRVRPDFISGLLAGDEAAIAQSRARLEEIKPIRPLPPKGEQDYSIRYLDVYQIHRSRSWGEFDYSVTSKVDAVMRQRLLNAFGHATKLCRAMEAAKRQEELNKSAKKPGDLF